MLRNHLAGETSPYLLQHADNPVEWYPWNETALERARREQKPILLSVGYSACHWCHVMAHESFEDPETAALMNRLFVNIKVDREERPDLDKIYQVAHQLITGHGGGWPLTMFLTADDHRPFFGGTYFPSEPRHGMPAFKDILARVAEYYRTHAAEVRQQNAELMQVFDELAPKPKDMPFDFAPLEAARSALEEVFDGTDGGFGRAPKFPHAGSIERCIKTWYHTSATTAPDLKALYMASLTLTRMAEGGLYDQLGGGFYRYSVDDSWTLPHFEKMLYDNGQLLATFATAALATGEELFARIARDTAAWLLRDMNAPEGGFYSSLDADSEGSEGKFYVWTREAVQELLSPAEYSAFAVKFGLDRAPNFGGEWHLRVHHAASDSSPPGPTAALVEAARVKLLAARDLRVWPLRDEKILTSWNALVIKGLAIAARALSEPRFAQAATRAVDFIHHSLYRDGRLLATYKDGRARLAAYLDDYAFLADALLELLMTRWRARDLEFAVELIEALLQHFGDPAGGGFFFTASDHERLIHRSKTFSDESVPAGNAVAASVLARMGYLLGETRYLEAAERTLRAGWGSLLDHPQAHMSLLDALEETLRPPRIVIVRGVASEAARWASSLAAAYAPDRMIFAIPSDAPGLPAALAEKRAADAPVAYVCRGSTCSAPIHDLDALARHLTARAAEPSTPGSAP